MLVFHAGMPKTGTTAVQEALAGARADLTENGILYPEFFFDSAESAHHPLAFALADADHDPLHLAQDLSGHIEQSNAHTIILSSEVFNNLLSRRNRDNLVRFLHGLKIDHNVKWVMSLRRMDEFMQSMYLQSVKMGEIASDIESYLAPRWNWFESVLEGFATLKNAQVPCTFSTLKYAHQPRFLNELSKELGLDHVSGIFDKRVKAANPTLGLKAQSFLLFLPDFLDRLPDGTNPHWVRSAISNGAFSFDDDITSYSVIAPRDRKLLHEMALRASLQYDQRAYFEFFSGTKEKPKEFRTLDKDVLTLQDIEKLRSFIAEHHPG